MERRKFMKKAGLGTATLSVSPLLWGNSKNWKGANDRVRVAVIGIRGFGQSHIREYNNLKNVEVAAICDIDENLFAERIKSLFTDRGFKKPKTYVDLRQLYEDKDIDAVSIVTPNHWHTLASIWAIQAGKHVSVEKPCCHNMYEGRKLVEAARKYKRVVQDGCEQRSNPCGQTMAKFLKDGGLGEVYMAKGLCYKWRDTIGKTQDEPVPAGVNYDLWLGPATKRPFNKNRFHYNWHWNWEYGNGDIGNQGVHEMDIARWGLGVTLPTKISAIGGHFMFDDDQETPNTMMAMFEFPNEKGGSDKKKIMQFEVRHWMTNSEGKHLGTDENAANTYMTSSSNIVGNIFYGSEGYMLKELNKWQAYMGQKNELGESGKGIGNHYQNFVDAIRANDPSMLTAPIEEGYYTCSLIHLANISYRLGRTINFDPQKQVIINDREANDLMTRNYRSPFVIPEHV
jgi:predicted dehydrogenase